MIVVWGTRLYGKVDRVPGLFYVATHFAYLQFIPLFPTASYLIIDGTEGSKGFQGVKISMSGKSVLYGYLRAVLVVASIGLIFAGGITLSKETGPAVGMIVGGLVAGLALWLSYRLSRPSPQRALRLATEAGIEPEVVAQHFVNANLLTDDVHEAMAANDDDDEATYRERRKV
jgi:hypothetical protein